MHALTNRHRLIASTVTAGTLLFLLALFATEILGHYGFGLFLGLPFVSAFTAVLFYGDDMKRVILTPVGLWLLTLLCGALLLIATGFEGVLCLIMATPIMLVFALAGVFTALSFHLLAKKWWRNRETGDRHGLYCIAIVLVPLLLGMYAEPHLIPDAPTRRVQTEVLIRGNINSVWDKVIAFPEITDGPDGIFAYGIAYPIRARMEGHGVGAIRHCTFNTGDFVEPITIWEAPHRLAFDVIENPVPMTEWSPWASIDPPHLHGFMVSERGQFTLEDRRDGTVLLKGRTWYHQKLWPNGYWGFISDQIIHRIHLRVLNHIKDTVEADA